MTVEAPTLARQPIWRRALAEFLGAGLLVAAVAGSGIAAQRLSTDAGLQLLENSIATALGLGVLILLFAPVSEAHFNPLVSLADFLLGRRTRTGLTGSAAAVYLAVQVAGAICGAMLANSAVTIGRMFTDTMAGIAPASVLPFLAAQLLGASIAMALAIALFPTRQKIDL